MEMGREFLPVRRFERYSRYIRMRFILRAGAPQRLGILAGAFNPPTVAHVALVAAARNDVDEVLCVLPRAFPHKPYTGATLAERIEMIEAVAWPSIPLSIGVTDGGLLIEIARECRAAYGQRVELLFICGRDAAERIVNWDYGEPDAFNHMLEEFGLLVAARGGEYAPPSHLAGRIRALPANPAIESVSSTDIRERIRRGEPWEHLAPESIVERINRIYSRSGE
jgi:nicotinate (nicotinamide) nucleotide adenylyltransferase